MFMRGREGRYTMVSLPVLLALITMFAWGGWAIFAKLSTQTLAAETATLITYLSGSLILLLNYLRLNDGVNNIATTGLLLAVGAGIASALGAITMYAALKSGQASIVTPISGLYFVVAAFLGIIFLEEPLSARKLVGISFAILSIVLITN